MLDFGLELESPITECMEYEWRDTKNDGNERYDIVGFTNLYKFQEANDVYRELFSKVPELLKNSTNKTILQLRSELSM